MSSATMAKGALQSFGGGAAPPIVSDGLKRIAALPDSLREGFWTLLAPHLAIEPDPRVEAFTDGVARENGVAPALLGPILQACRELFFQAARRDLAKDVFETDLVAMELDDATRAVLLACYPEALPHIRSQFVLDSLHEFGPAMDDVRFRITYLPATRHQPERLIPVAQLSIRYRDGADEGRLNLQVSPEMLGRLKLFVDGLVSTK